MDNKNNTPSTADKPELSLFDRIIRRTEEVFFTTVLVFMIVLGLAPIIMRYSGAMGFSWTESMSQQMVLWIALIGASTAIRERSSISIDVIPHLLKPKGRLMLMGISELISGLICGILVWFSISFVRSMVEFDSETIAFLGIPEWWLVCAMPIGFFILTLRLLIAGIQDIIKAVKMKKGEESLPPPAIPVDTEEQGV